MCYTLLCEQMQSVWNAPDVEQNLFLFIVAVMYLKEQKEAC